VLSQGAAGLQKLGAATSGAEREARAFNLTALRQNQVVEGVNSKLRGLLLSVTTLAGAGGIGLLVKRGYDYNQQLESQRNSIAAILAANRQYVDSNGSLLDANAAFQAGLSESDQLLVTIQKRALETAATVPQIGDAFATALGAAKSSGLKQDLDAILESTVRIVQAAGAFGVPLDQLRQEVNSLFMGQVTEDSVIARKLGLDNASVRKAIASGKLYEEIIRRTDSIAVAAKAQANTLSGVIVNVAEMIDATVSKAINSSLGGIKGFIAGVGDTVMRNGPQIAAVVTIITKAAGDAISRVAEWTREHSALIKEIAAIGLVVGAAVAAYALIGAAIAAITSPVGLTIAAIIALALVWEKAREFAEIEVAGRPISAYVRASWDFIGGITAAFVQTLLTHFKVLWSGTKAIFGALVEVLIAPMRAVTSLIASVPDAIAALVPGGSQAKAFAVEIKGLLDTTAAAYSPLDNLKQIGSDLAESWSVSGELVDQTVEKMSASLQSKEKLPSIADSIFGGVADAFRKRIAEMTDAASSSNKPGASPNTKGGTAHVIPEEIRKAFTEYLAFVEDVRKKAYAAGDPVAEALENVEKKRREALRKIDDARTNPKFAQIAHDYAADAEVVREAFDLEAIEAASNVIKSINDRTLAGMRSLQAATREIAAQIEADRIARITDADERELAQRLQANKDWFATEREKVESEVESEKTKYQILGKLAEEKKRRDARDQAEADKKRDEQLVGLSAWVEKIRQTIRDRFGSISQQITDSVLASVDAVQSAFSKLFDGIIAGQLDLGKSFEDFSKQLGSIWSHVLSNMLTRTIATGDSIVSQLRSVAAQMNNLRGVDAALAGAGVGSLVGGLGQTVRPNSYASIGGTIGGALGAIVGSFVGSTALGAIIGSAIGTAIGGAIQKGKDHIQVAITAAANAALPAVSVIEKGISADARARVMRDIQRQVGEVIKSYQSLIDLFPEQYRELLRKAVKPLNITGGVETADITDENALQSLSTFLSEAMPQGIFTAYKDAISKGLSLLGVSKDRLEQEMKRLGQLQGKELQDAVRAYVSTVVETTSLRDKFMAPFEEVERAAREGANFTQLQRIASINGPLSTLVASMSRLDVTDQLAAASEVNRLTQQKYEMEIAYLQRIDQIQQAIGQSSQQLRDQITLAGLDDNGKLSFDFERIRELRSQLLVSTDPEQIQTIAQQIHSYISQALSLGGSNATLRDQLMSIVNDVEAISGGQLSKAKQAVEEQHQKTAELMKTAAEMLMKASTALADAVGGTGFQIPPGTVWPGQPTDPLRPRNPFHRIVPDVAGGSSLTAGLDDVSRALTDYTTRIDRIRESLDSALPSSLADRWMQFDDGVALAVTNLREFNQGLGAARPAGRSEDMRTVIALLGRIADQSERELRVTGDGRGFLQDMGFAIEQRVIRRIRRDPDILRGFSD
jgi:hypothetical protein